MSGRPLDELEAAVGADVTVRLKSGEVYQGRLSGYDQHMNLVLEDLESGPGSAPASDAGETAGGDAGDAPEGEAGETAEPAADEATEAAATPEGGGTPVDEDTTIIRGDNVVSITL